MPFALVIIGLILIVAGAKNTYKQLGAQLQSDFTGQGNFTYWLIALGVLGAIGSVPSLKRISHLLLALTIIAMILKNGGLFDKVTQFLKNGAVAPTASPPVTTKPTQTADAGSSSSTASNIASIAEFAALA